MNARFIVNGLYDFPCFLVLIGITLTGEIVFASSLFRATGYDAHFFFDTEHLHPQYTWERNIGDGHFSTCPQFDTPAKRVGGRNLTPLEHVWNNWLQLVARVWSELNKVAKNHRMFAGEPFRGWVRQLAVFVKITLHATAVELRCRNKRGHRYEPYGYWAHGP